MEWVASTLYTTSEYGVSSITTADVHTSTASSRLNWRPRRFNCTRPFRRKTKSDFCACAITFQTQSTTVAMFYIRTRNVMEHWTAVLARGSQNLLCRQWRWYKPPNKSNCLIASPISSYFNQAFFLRGEGLPLSRTYSSRFEAGVAQSQSVYTELFISPSWISELDCGTTKTDTAERSISIRRESLQVFFFL